MTGDGWYITWYIILEGLCHKSLILAHVLRYIIQYLFYPIWNLSIRYDHTLISYVYNHGINEMKQNTDHH